jgi:hypothetical protein
VPDRSAETVGPSWCRAAVRPRGKDAVGCVPFPTHLTFKRLMAVFSETAIRDCDHAQMTQHSFQHRETPANERFFTQLAVSNDNLAVIVASARRNGLAAQHIRCADDRRRGPIGGRDARPREPSCLRLAPPWIVRVVSPTVRHRKKEIVLTAPGFIDRTRFGHRHRQQFVETFRPRSVQPRR